MDPTNVLLDGTAADLNYRSFALEYSTADGPEDWRPIINIPYDGQMVVKREVYYDPEIHDSQAQPYLRVKEWLSLVANKMEKEHFNKEAGTGPLIPADFLLIRADQSTAFRHIQKLMTFCGEKGVQIWKVQLAASEPPSEDGAPAE